MTIVKNAKLSYFPGRGKGELSRYVLHYHGIPFEDNRVQPANWPAIKSTMPVGQLPVLEFTDENGKHHVMCQSGTIARALGRWYGSQGKTDDETAKADEIYECIRDIVEESGSTVWEKDAEKKEQKFKHLKEDVVPRVFGHIEKTLEAHGKKFVAGGDSFTYADFFVSVIIDNISNEFVVIPNVGFRATVATLEELGAKYPLTVAVKKAVDASPNIAKHLATRPQTTF